MPTLDIRSTNNIGYRLRGNKAVLEPVYIECTSGGGKTFEYRMKPATSTLVNSNSVTPYIAQSQVKELQLKLLRMYDRTNIEFRVDAYFSNNVAAGNEIYLLSIPGNNDQLDMRFRFLKPVSQNTGLLFILKNLTIKKDDIPKDLYILARILFTDETYGEATLQLATIKEKQPSLFEVSPIRINQHSNIHFSWKSEYELNIRATFIGDKRLTKSDTTDFSKTGSVVKYMTHLMPPSVADQSRVLRLNELISIVPEIDLHYLTKIELTPYTVDDNIETIHEQDKVTLSYQAVPGLWDLHLLPGKPELVELLPYPVDNKIWTLAFDEDEYLVLYYLDHNEEWIKAACRIDWTPLEKKLADTLNGNKRSDPWIKPLYPDAALRDILKANLPPFTVRKHTDNTFVLLFAGGSKYDSNIPMSAIFAVVFPLTPTEKSMFPLKLLPVEQSLPETIACHALGIMDMQPGTWFFVMGGHNKGSAYKDNISIGKFELSVLPPGNKHENIIHTPIVKLEKPQVFSSDVALNEVARPSFSFRPAEVKQIKGGMVTVPASVVISFGYSLANITESRYLLFQYKDGNWTLWNKPAEIAGIPGLRSRDKSNTASSLAEPKSYNTIFTNEYLLQQNASAITYSFVISNLINQFLSIQELYIRYELTLGIAGLDNNGQLAPITAATPITTFGERFFDIAQPGTSRFTFFCVGVNGVLWLMAAVYDQNALKSKSARKASKLYYLVMNENPENTEERNFRAI